MTVVKSHGSALKHASKDLRNIVIIAEISDGSASEDVRNNRLFMKAIILCHGRVLEYTSDNLRNSRDIVLVTVTTVTSSWLALQLTWTISEMIKRSWWLLFYSIGRPCNMLQKDVWYDRGNVMAAVRYNWKALQFASYDLRNDQNIVKAAINPMESFAIWPKRCSKWSSYYGDCCKSKAERFAVYLSKISK